MSDLRKESTLHGRDALEALARRFPQLYLTPAEDALEDYALAAGRGIAPEGATLDLFVTTPADELRVVDTPAGPVEVLYLAERADFENVLRLIGRKAQPVPIAPTVGAITYRNLPDWGKVAAARKRYLAEGGDDWPAEFGRLAGEPGAFRAELIVISEGPYSNIAATQTPYGPDEWLDVSREIRLHHECAHVVCRRVMSDVIVPVWDEVTADVAGLLAATGRYDARLAALFLGVDERGFTGGRLSEYLDDEQKARIDEVAAEVFGTLGRIEAQCGDAEAQDPFGFVLRLKRAPLLDY